MTIEISDSPESTEVLAALGRKDADFIEKFIGKVLKLSSEYWGTKATEAFEKDRQNPGEEYSRLFDQWHRLRLNQVHIDDELQRGTDRTEEMPWEQTAVTTTSTSPTSEED